MVDAPRTPIRTRGVGWHILILFLVVATGLQVLFLVLRNVEPFAGILRGPDWRENLIIYSVKLLVAVGGIACALGRLRLADLGVRGGRFLEGLVVVVGVWCLAQVVNAIFVLGWSGNVELDRSWHALGAVRIVRWTAVMFAGTALYEEIAFRGFIFPQLYLKTVGSDRFRFWVATLVSQALFGASHIPGHLMLRHMSGIDTLKVIVAQALIGVLLVLIYARTRNLWIAVGVHGLIDAPTPLVDGPLSWEPFLLVLLLLWPRIMRRPEEGGLARVIA